MSVGSTVITGVGVLLYGCHVFDHLAADGACLTGGQVTVVTVLQVDAHFPWCPFYILNSPDKGVPTGF